MRLDAHPELTANVVVGIFRRIYAESWGPRTDGILRSAILTATTSPDATLADVPRLLDNDIYRAGLVLAHQNLTQLPAELRDSLAANARNKIVFTVSPNDARQLERHMAPQLGAHDLANLGAFQAAARLLDHGALTNAFTSSGSPSIGACRGQINVGSRASRSAKGAR